MKEVSYYCDRCGNRHEGDPALTLYFSVGRESIEKHLCSICISALLEWIKKGTS